MVTSACLVIQRGDSAVHDNADTSRTTTNVDDCSLCELKQCLGRGNLVDQTATGDSRVFQNVTTRPGLGRRHSRGKGSCGRGNLLLQCSARRDLELLNGSNCVAKVYN